MSCGRLQGCRRCPAGTHPVTGGVLTAFGSTSCWGWHTGTRACCRLAVRVPPSTGGFAEVLLHRQGPLIGVETDPQSPSGRKYFCKHWLKEVRAAWMGWKQFLFSEMYFLLYCIHSEIISFSQANIQTLKMTESSAFSSKHRLQW